MMDLAEAIFESWDEYGQAMHEKWRAELERKRRERMMSALERAAIRTIPHLPSLKI